MELGFAVKFVTTVQQLKAENDKKTEQIELLMKSKADHDEVKAELESLKERQRSQFVRIGELDNRIDKIDQQTSF